MKQSEQTLLSRLISSPLISYCANQVLLQLIQVLYHVIAARMLLTSRCCPDDTRLIKRSSRGSKSMLYHFLTPTKIFGNSPLQDMLPCSHAPITITHSSASDHAPSTPVTITNQGQGQGQYPLRSLLPRTLNASKVKVKKLAPAMPNQQPSAQRR
jgi:hypothetical protein